MDYQEFIVETLGEAAQIARDWFGRATIAMEKDGGQVVTEADMSVGRMIVEAVERVYPEHNIIDEELGVVDKQSRYSWVVDPIDGTSNFAVGSPLYGCMLGLLKDHEPIADGFVLPAFDEIYSAERGKGRTVMGGECR